MGLSKVLAVLGVVAILAGVLAFSKIYQYGNAINDEVQARNINSYEFYMDKNIEGVIVDVKSHGDRVRLKIKIGGGINFPAKNYLSNMYATEYPDKLIVVQIDEHEFSVGQRVCKGRGEGVFHVC